MITSVQSVNLYELLLIRKYQFRESSFMTPDLGMRRLDPGTTPGVTKKGQE